MALHVLLKDLVLTVLKIKRPVDGSLGYVISIAAFPVNLGVTADLRSY